MHSSMCAQNIHQDGLYPRIDDIHQTKLHKFKRTGIIQSMYSDRNEIKQKINNRKTSENFPNPWKFDDTSK